MKGHTRQRVSLVLAAVVVMFGVKPDLLLCVGEEGHLGIEFSIARCCARDGGAAVVERADDGCAAGCTDAPFGGAAAITTPENSHLRVVTFEVAAAASMNGPTVTSVSRVSARRAAPPRLSPRELDTTVLIC